MPLQNIPTVPTLQINSHSPLHTPSLRPSRAHKLPSRASQSYLCYRQAARCPYTGLPAQLFHKHSPELSGGCTPTTAQLRPLPRQLQSSRTRLLGGHAMARVPVPRDAGQSGNFDTRMKCAFERLMPTHHTNNWLSSF